MARILFTNVSIFDGTGAAPYAGEVVEGNRIYNSEARSGMQSQGVFMNSRPNGDYSLATKPGTTEVPEAVRRRPALAAILSAARKHSAPMPIPASTSLK
jgi:hypothetical protein